MKEKTNLWLKYKKNFILRNINNIYFQNNNSQIRKANMADTKTPKVYFIMKKFT